MYKNLRYKETKHRRPYSLLYKTTSLALDSDGKKRILTEMKTTPCKVHRKPPLGVTIYCVSYYCLYNFGVHLTAQVKSCWYYWYAYQWCDGLIGWTMLLGLCCTHYYLWSLCYCYKPQQKGGTDDKIHFIASCLKTQNVEVYEDLFTHTGIASASVNLELFNFTSGVCCSLLL